MTSFDDNLKNATLADRNDTNVMSRSISHCRKRGQIKSRKGWRSIVLFVSCVHLSIVVCRHKNCSCVIMSRDWRAKVLCWLSPLIRGKTSSRNDDIVSDHMLIKLNFYIPVPCVRSWLYLDSIDGDISCCLFHLQCVGCGLCESTTWCQCRNGTGKKCASVKNEREKKEPGVLKNSN